MSFSIRVQLDETSQVASPGSTVYGTAIIDSRQPIVLRDVSIKVVSGNHKGKREHLSGSLGKNVRVASTAELPIAVTFPSYSKDLATATWTVVVEAYHDGDTVKGSAAVRVVATTSQKSSEYVAGSIISFVIASMGLLGMNMGIVGVPTKIIPEGVRWFAFIMGMLFMFATSAIMGGRSKDGRRPWLALPGSILIGGTGLVCLYMFLIQPGLYPYGILTAQEGYGMSMQGLQSLVSFYTNDAGSQRLMLLCASCTLIPIGVSLITIRKTKATLLGDIAFTTISLVGTVIFVCSFFGNAYPFNIALALLTLCGAISGYYAFTSGRWSEAATPTMLTFGAVPFTIGLASVVGAHASPEPFVERIIGIGIMAISAVIAYTGVRNVLVQLFFGSVTVRVSPQRVSVGQAVIIDVGVSPHRTSTLEDISAVLTCTQSTSHMVGSERRYNSAVVYRTEAREVVNLELFSGSSEAYQLRIPIPVGQQASYTSVNNTISWSIEVRVAIKGKPNWAGSYSVEVV